MQVMQNCANIDAILETQSLWKINKYFKNNETLLDLIFNLKNIHPSKEAAK